MIKEFIVKTNIVVSFSSLSILFLPGKKNGFQPDRIAHFGPLGSMALFSLIILKICLKAQSLFT